MPDLAYLRQQAGSMPSVMINSAVLLELLDIADRAASKPKKQRVAKEPTGEDERCALWLFGVILNTAPEAKKPNIAAWSADIRLMRERDDRTHKQICEMFRWAHDDQFWCANILSPKKLREHWDRLTIQRQRAEQPKKTGGAWWASEASIRAKGDELGLRPHAHESWPDFKGRIQAAIDNGGAPPPVSHAPALALAPPPTERRGVKPEGLDLKSLVRPYTPPTRAA